MDGLRALLAHAGDAAERAAALAGVTSEIAEGVRRVAARVQVTERTPWRSVAADAFRGGASSVVAGLGRVADELDGVGPALRVHAAAAAARAGDIAVHMTAVERLLGEGRDDLARAAQEALERTVPWPWRTSWR
jgi:hypothetical protein